MLLRTISICIYLYLSPSFAVCLPPLLQFCLLYCILCIYILIFVVLSLSVYFSSFSCYTYAHIDINTSTPPMDLDGLLRSPRPQGSPAELATALASKLPKAGAVMGALMLPRGGATVLILWQVSLPHACVLLW